MEYIKFISAALLNVLLVIGVYFLEKKTRFWKLKRIYKELIIGVLFGVSSIYASCFGVKIWGATMNVRDASPISAGLIFGPIAGIVSGCMGGGFRALTVLWNPDSSFTALACSISTVLAGCVAAILRKYMFDDKKAGWAPAMGPPPHQPQRGGGGVFCPRALAAATAATAHSGGAAAGGSGTPRLPLGSLEKAFSPRARRPSPGSSLSFGPAEALHEPPVPSWAGGVCGTGRRGTNTSAPARPRPAQSPRPVPCKASSVSLHDEEHRHASPTASTPPPDESHSRDTHTHHRGGDPRRTPGLRETTPPLGLRHLRDDLERSRGTTEGRSRTRAGRGARSAAAAEPSPPRGEPLAEHTPGRRSESICCVNRPTAPTDAPRRGTGDRRSGPETATQLLPSSPSTTGRGERQARGPVSRPRRADAFTRNARPSSGTA